MTLKVKVLNEGFDQQNVDLITQEAVIGKILKIYVDLGDVSLATIKIANTEGEDIMNREFKESGVYKPMDAIVEANVYEPYYSEYLT